MAKTFLISNVHILSEKLGWENLSGSKRCSVAVEGGPVCWGTSGISWGTAGGHRETLIFEYPRRWTRQPTRHSIQTFFIPSIPKLLEKIFWNASTGFRFVSIDLECEHNPPYPLRGSWGTAEDRQIFNTLGRPYDNFRNPTRKFRRQNLLPDIPVTSGNTFMITPHCSRILFVRVEVNGISPNITK